MHKEMFRINGENDMFNRKKKVVIFGMCHNCFKSNVEMSNIKEILCVDCVPSIN